MSELISRQAAIDAMRRLEQEDIDSYGVKIVDVFDGERAIEALKALPSVQSEPRWIPVKTRPMTEEERQYYSELYGYDIEYEEAIMFDCKMPKDGQEIWVCSKCGNVWEDTWSDDGYCDKGIRKEKR